MFIQVQTKTADSSAKNSTSSSPPVHVQEKNNEKLDLQLRRALEALSDKRTGSSIGAGVGVSRLSKKIF